MATWTSEELNKIGRAEELEIAVGRAGTPDEVGNVAALPIYPNQIPHLGNAPISEMCHALSTLTHSVTARMLSPARLNALPGML
jgi:hypothetical protein